MGRTVPSTRRACRLSATMALLLAWLVTVGGTAGAQGATPAGPGATPATPGATPVKVAEVDKVALITPASRTNQGWDQQAADGITAVAERRGFEVEVAENAGYEDIEPILADLAEGGTDLIVCHASGYQTTCPEFAAEEGVPIAVVENPGAVTPGLVSDIETQAQEAAYLAGVLAGKLTKTGTVGVVVSDEPPTWNFMTVGFAEGLKAANPNANLEYAVVGVAAYEDAAGAKRATEAVLAAGADIVFGMGDGASFGMIQAISEHNARSENAGKPALFIDVIGDKRSTVKDGSLLTSVLFDYTGVYDQMIGDLETGQFGKVYTMTLANGGVKLLDLPDSVPAEVKAAVDQARAGIVGGQIGVSAVGDAEGVKQKLDELFPD